MIVKVQTAFNNPNVLIYNEDRSVWIQLEGDQAKTMRKDMRMDIGGLRRYYEADFTDGVLTVDHRVPDEEW